MLKLLACLFMLLDHIGYYFAFALPDPLVILLRSVGRLAFPIFAWSVALGFTRTSNPLRYFLRMSFFAVLTEICFRYAHDLAGMITTTSNVLVTFALAIVLLSGYQVASHSYLDMIISMRPIAASPQHLPSNPRYDVRVSPGGIQLDRRIGLPLGLFMIFLAMAGVILLKPDYGFYGLLAVLLFYAVHDRFPETQQKKYSILGFTILNIIFLFVRIFSGETTPDWAILQCLSILAVPLCYSLNRQHKPSLLVKYAFYLFYPIHVLVLLALRILFWSN